MKLIKKKLLLIPVPERQFLVEKHYEVKAEIHPYEGEDIIVATIWYSLNKEPTYRVFITKNSYITQIFTGKEPWSSASISYHTSIGYYRWYGSDKHKEYADEKTLEILKKRSNIVNATEDDSIWLINCIQAKIRENKILEKEAREQAVWDAELNTTPEIPDDLMKWAKEKLFAKERYIFYETTRSKEKKGKCSNCEGYVTLINPKQGQIGTCPNCGSYVEYRNGNRQKYINSSRKDMKLVQMTTAGKVVVREFRWQQNIKIDSFNDFEIKRTYWETERRFVSKSRNIKKYSWEFYKQKKMRFVECSGNYNSYYGSSTKYTYMDDIDSIKSYLSCCFQYLPDSLFERKINVMQLISHPNTNGMIERLWKRGLHNLAADMTGQGNIYANEKALFKDNRVENDDLKIFQSADITLSELYQWKDVKKSGKRPTADEIMRSREQGISLRSLSELSKYTSIRKILNYLNVHKNDVTMYKDYLNMLEELGMDTKSNFNLFPKNLHKRHDELVEAKNEQANLKLKKKLDKTHSAIAKMENELNKKYAVENKTCFIRAPHSAYEIALEGQKLHHCVGGDGYRDKMKRGESFILFVRKKEAPDEPWWTIEVGANNNIRQYHGWGNKDKDKSDVEPIMNKFRKRLEQLKADEEKAKIVLSAAV